MVHVANEMMSWVSPMPAAAAARQVTRRFSQLAGALRGGSQVARQPADQPTSSASESGAAPPTTMRAMVVKKGGLSLEEIATPTPRPGQVLIEVHASSVNPVDYKIYENRDPSREPWRPGFDLSGVVAVVGEGCTRLAVGDHVWADNAGYLGAAAEYVICDEARVGLKPAGLSHVEAASLPLVALTSLQTLQHGAVGGGSKVLIIGGSSGCGYTGAMLAVAMGARVTATCSGRNVAFVKSLGVERVIDYTEHDWSAVLRGENFDCVVDMIGPGGGEEHTVPRAAPCMAPSGRFISITTSDDEGAFRGTDRIFEHIVTKSDDYRDLDFLKAQVDAGALKPVVAATYPLAELETAYEMNKTHRTVGKIGIVVKGGALATTEELAGNVTNKHSLLLFCDDQSSCRHRSIPATKNNQDHDESGFGTGAINVSMNTPIIVDIRSAEEREKGPTVGGSLHLEWNRESETMPLDGLPADKTVPLFVH